MPNNKQEEDRIIEMIRLLQEGNDFFSPEEEYRNSVLRYKSHLVINELAKCIVELKRKYEPNNITSVQWEIDGAISRSAQD